MKKREANQCDIMIKKLLEFKEIYQQCRDKGPGSYIGPQALSEDVEWSEEEQIVIRGFNLKSHE